MAHNYILQVTAGPEYDIKTHQVVPVNSSTPVSIDSDLVRVDLNVRIQVTALFLYIKPIVVTLEQQLTPSTELPRPPPSISLHLTLFLSPTPQ